MRLSKIKRNAIDYGGKIMSNFLMKPCKDYWKQRKLQKEILR